MHRLRRQAWSVPENCRAEVIDAKDPDLGGRKLVSARVLVVDDNAPNRRLLETLLNAEYFDVLTASNGPDAIEICGKTQCDVVLLDVMMPEMDGFEVCRRLRSQPTTAHLPIVMVTALDQPAHLLRGLETGADDFVTKPIDGMHLIARVRSLARLKVVIDEMRGRAATNSLAGQMPSFADNDATFGQRGHILLVDDQESSSERLVRALASHHDVRVETVPQAAMSHAADREFDVIIINLGLQSFDALRLCGQVRALERTRHLPILLIADPEDRARVLRGLELGVGDCLSRPVNRNELLARVRTQLRYKRYADSLREQLRETVELASFDPLTGLNNRRFLEIHLAELIGRARAYLSTLTVMIVDIDHFKRVNDTFGHDAGDEVLKTLSQRLRSIIRAGDLLCRMGGEEFLIVMPGADAEKGAGIAERARLVIEREEFAVGGSNHPIPITTSIGLAELRADQDWRELYRRADQALYRAKSEGRNRVKAAA